MKPLRTRDVAILAAGASAVAACALYFDCLGAGKSIFGRDTASHDYGVMLWAWDEMKATGRLPLWNPLLYCGIPMLGSFALCPFTPSAVFFAALPFPLAFACQYLFAFAVGGTGMALLARRMGLGAAPAIAIAVLFALSGHFTTLAHAGHLTKALAFCWTPWLFAAADYCFERRTWRGAAAIALPFALMLSASHFQIAYLAGLFLIGWLTWKLAASGLWRQPKTVARLGVLFGGAVGLASALAAAQLLPGLEMAPLSNRTQGVSFEEAARTSYPPKELLEYVIPGWLGSSAENGRGPYLGSWGRSMPERIVSDYFGILALALAGLGLFRSSRRDRWLWAAMALIGIWIGIGDNTFALKFLREAMPGFERFRSPAVAMGWTTIAALVLAAMGLEWLFALRIDSDKRRERFAALWAGVAIVLVAGCAIARNRVFSLESATHGLDLSSPGGHSVLASISTARSLAYALTVLAAGSALAAGSCWLAKANGGRSGARAVVAILWVLALVLDVGWRSRDYVSRPLDHADFENYFRNGTPQQARDDPRQPVRIAQQGQELSNVFLGAGVGSLFGYHPLFYSRYERILQSLDPYGPQMPSLFHQNWLLAPPGWTPHDSWLAKGASTRGNLYARNVEPPYIRFPGAVSIAADADGVFDKIGAADFDPQAIAYLEPDSGIEAANYSGAATAELLEYGLNSIAFKAELEAERVAVFADVMAPGWTLSPLDAQGKPGRPIKTFYANGALRGAILRSGAHHYLWRYEPFSFRLGGFLSLLTLGGLICAAIGLRRQG